MPLLARPLPEQITGDDVYGTYLQWKKEGRQQYTCANRYSTLRGFLHYMGINPKNIVDTVEHGKMKFKPKKIVQTYTDEEIKKLIAASSERHALLLRPSIFELVQPLEHTIAAVRTGLCHPAQSCVTPTSTSMANIAGWCPKEITVEQI